MRPSDVRSKSRSSTESQLGPEAGVLAGTSVGVRVAADGTPESYYVPRHDADLLETCEPGALEFGMYELRRALNLARRALETVKARDEYLRRALARLKVDLRDDDRLAELSQTAAAAQLNFESNHGTGRPWCEDLERAQDRRGRP